MNPIIHMNHAMNDEPEYTPPPTDPIAAARHALKGALALRHTRHTGERKYWTRRAIQCLTDYRAIREPIKPQPAPAEPAADDNPTSMDWLPTPEATDDPAGYARTGY